MSQTLGAYLLNSSLPKGMKFTGPVTAKHIQNTLVDLARKDPASYVKTVTELKRLGDEFATVEGISVGLDDIAPHYTSRDPILDKAHKDIQKMEDPAKRRKLITDTQAKMVDAVKKHPGDMRLMAESGGRGNWNQLMKTVSSPVAVADAKGQIVPWLIRRSYSEGLRPAEYWIAGDEARQSVVEGKIQVTEPGTVGKLMIATMMDQVVASPDCGTHNGIPVPTTDAADLVDRFLAHEADGFPRNTLLTSDVIMQLNKKKIKSVIVRSPMTCAQTKGGVCQKCMGLSERGQLHTIGTNVGVRAAQAASEPLTQMTLSAKHGTRLAKGQSAELKGLPAIQTYLNVPQSFLYAATLAKEDGKIGAIKAAPQGGNYITIGKVDHYVPPDLNVIVKTGDKVEAGDALSDGIPRPDEVVEHKGIGYGRKYLVDRLHNVYKDAGVDLDKRHLELLAKSHLNYVRIEDDPKEEFLKTDIVNFNQIRNRLEHEAEEMPLEKAEGHILAHDYQYFLAGTRVTPTVVAALKPHYKVVKVATKDAPKFQFIMKPINQTPLLNPDWFARLGFEKLRNSIHQGAQFAEQANIHGYHPLPGFVHGTEFGEGLDGAY